MFQLKNKQFTAKEYIENFFYIINDDRERVPFLFNDIQNKLYNNLTHKNNVLKSRKVGISSEILALWLVSCLFEDNIRAVVISHEREATQRLLDRVYYYIDNLAVRPTLEKASANDIKFTETNSSFWIGTAGAKAFGRGDDITHLHISEYDWWENTDMLTGVLEACVSDAYIVIETTGNGFNSPFHQLWEKVENKLSDYTNHFFGWNESEKNSLPITEQKFTVTPDEIQLATAYKLNNEQINWRRMKLRTMAKPELFPQEHPLNDTEAFLFSGRSYFNTSRLKLYLDNAKEPSVVGYLKKNVDIIEFIPDTKGSLKIWEKPKSKLYVIGGDVAEGIGQDFSIAIVVDAVERNVVATLKCDISPSEFGRELAKLGTYYNNAFIGCEVNNHGLTSLTILKEQEKYGNLYYRRTVDKVTNKETKQIGWKTTQTTRPLMLDNLDKAIREGLVSIPSKDIIKELISFIIDRDGKTQSQAGGNDDFVIGLAIALYVLPYIPKVIIGNPQTYFNSRGKGGG